MSKIRVAINGFGRIGRITYRAMLRNQNIELVAINDLTDAENLAHLLKYDSVHGLFPGHVSTCNDCLTVDGKKIRVFSNPNPGGVDWGALDIDIVIESTGQFTDKVSAMKHIRAGARKVIISAPAKNESDDVKYIVLGINDHIIAADDQVISNASCTTNCVAPLIQILDDHWHLEKGFITTVHSYTRDQNLIDAPHKDWRRGRAAAYSIIPTTTGAAKAATKIFPHLKNNLGGAGIRVPVPDGSLTDLTCTVKKSTSIHDINEAFKEAAYGRLKGILQYTEDPIVSVDVIGNTHSAVFDAGLTAVLGDKNKLVKVVAWYDNEMGYASRLVELIEKFA
ncbi:MAG: type I glyceraldehyde-3-phosphate dehydrogenase [Bacteroidales bacterium]|nr:type I glyceraldehyde-3-phosphate dehydrogenase [Bacteroidales bacterium]MDZ4203993.1 type I glyceraldehyde-3-phosphate dehydrogenase [Bacteroidales bacterium]